MKITHVLAISIVAGVATNMLQAQSTITIPAGTDILIRANETIDSRTADEGRVYKGTVDQDVLDSAGNVAVHKGSEAELLVREVQPKKELVLDLQSLIVNGRRHFVNADDYESIQKRKSVGRNWRTAKMVGGGSIFGSILGALAGDGQGAAIGALSGAAAGGALQVFTRGKTVKVPAEAVLTFRLEKPLHLYPVR